MDLFDLSKHTCTCTMAQLLSCIGSHMLVAVRPLVRRRTGTSSSGKSTQVLHDFRGGTCRLQSWSKVMVHLVHFLTISPFLPPSPRTMLGQCAQSVPLEATLYEGGGGRAKFGKRAAFIIEQAAMMKTKQIFKVYHILLTRIVPQNSSV